MECPKCGGPTWDNRPKKAEGKMKPNAPDFACKDKEDCGWKQWPERQKKQDRQAPIPRGPKWTWHSLSTTYERCLKLAEKHVPSNVNGAAAADILSAAATLFIAVSRDGVAPLEKEKPPEPEVTREELERDDEPLPF